MRLLRSIEPGVIALEIRPDHVHLLVEVDPQFGLHRLVKYIKGVTSHNSEKSSSLCELGCLAFGRTVTSVRLLVVRR